jgi:hypothetical protein
MERLAFRQLPRVVQIAVGVAFFTAWVCFEEFVVDRVGLWKYMPFYRVAKGCVWDLTVATVITFTLWRAAVARPR